MVVRGEFALEKMQMLWAHKPKPRSGNAWSQENHFIIHCGDSI